MYLISISIVLFNSPEKIYLPLIKKLINSDLDISLIIVDNDKDRKKVLISNKITYLKNKKNYGFGKSHNIALKKISYKSKFHLFLNPDMKFSISDLKKLIKYMEAHKEIDLLMPNIKNFSGQSLNYCKRLPTPYDLLIRRFAPFIKSNYEIKNIKNKIIKNVPNLSGCFLLTRTKTIKQIDGFDERFFLYMEDVDLVRRVCMIGQTIFFPKTTIFHQEQRGSYKSYKLLLVHAISAIKYFNKWGWFYDKDRRKLNKF